jgi:hypothetical protein
MACRAVHAGQEVLNISVKQVHARKPCFHLCQSTPFHLLDYANWVVTLLVEVDAHLLVDVVCHIVGLVLGEDFIPRRRLAKLDGNCLRADWGLPQTEAMEARSKEWS